MPARTNKFQRLIRAIQGHLSRSGTVSESRILSDRHTGSPVEVDIVIEESVGGHVVLVGVECTSERRKATIEWYREMRAKHADLPIAKTVLVSESGFTQEVYRKAQIDGITLLRLGDVKTFKWQALLVKLQGSKVADVSFSLRKFSIKFHPDWDSSISTQVGPWTIVRGPGIECSLGQWILEVARDGGLTAMIMSQMNEIMKKTDHFSFSFNAPVDTRIEVLGKQAEILEIEATLSFHPKYKTIEWQTAEFNGSVVATGSIPANFFSPGAAGDAVMTVSVENPESIRITLLGASDRDVELKTFPSALWDVNNGGKIDGST